MKQQILIVLFSIAITTSYGQDASVIPNRNSSVHSIAGEPISNQPTLGFSGSPVANDSYTIVRSTLGIGGFSKTITTNGRSYIICQSIGQSSVIGTYSQNTYTFMQGFQQPINSARIFKLPPEDELLINLYPNPFSHYVNISFNDPVAEDVFVQLTDITGKIIYTNKFPAAQLISLPLNHLQYGVYILKVIAGNKQFRANLIKQYQ